MLRDTHSEPGLPVFKQTGTDVTLSQASYILPCLQIPHFACGPKQLINSM